MGVNAFYYPDDFVPLMAKVVDLWEQGKIAPPVEAEYPFEDVPEVFRRLAERKVKGRVVIKSP
jgi:D-arabinose 1-dehydrogenase-like Zn-dependent alcohol dehydrogenase